MAGYIPNTRQDRSEMLSALGLKNTDELFKDLPEGVRLKDKLKLDDGLNEIQVKKKLGQIANKNNEFDACFLGAGVYNHFIPAIVKQITSRGEFVSGYTPYQAEMSQGVLQSIFEYQTMMCYLTGLDVSNASVYDGATALAEAVMMTTQGKKRKVVVSEAINPEYLSVLKTWCEYCEVEIQTVAVKNYKTDMNQLKQINLEDVGAIVMQNPNFFGSFEDMQEASDFTHVNKALFISAVNPISLAICQCPADYNADIAVGEGQPLGNPMAGGGPYLGFMVAKKKLMRKLPGRIVGQTVDTDGKRGFVLTLQAREQHIRRERASSNICSNQALNALTAAVYLGAMGPSGLTEVATHSMNNAHHLHKKLTALKSVETCNRDFFNEFVLKIKCDHETLEERLHDKKILGPLYLGNYHYLFATTEQNTKQDIDLLFKVFSEVTDG